MSIYSQSEIDNLYDDMNLFRNTSLRMSGNIADVGLIRKFFRVWANSGGGNSGYQVAVGNLPKDKPNTSQDEEITEDSFKKRAEDFFGKSWSQILAENKSTTDIENHITQLSGKIRLYIGQQQALNTEAEDVQRRIDDANASNKEDFSTPYEG